MEKRHQAWKQRKRDRNLHPIPFLADGPGSGKSRFLQELPSSFINYISQGTYSQEFKDIFKSRVCINITFGNGSKYTIEEAKEISIEQSVCLRILYQFERENTDFSIFYHTYKSQIFSLAHILRQIDASCIILGIDEVNKVYEVGVHNPKVFSGVKQSQLSALFGLFGSVSCEFSYFVIPVLAGTVIGPIKSVVRESTHPPLHIPLPLLSFESSLNIFAKKNTKFSQLVQTSRELRQLISDCGGHCRSLEILYDGLLKLNSESNSFWDDVAAYVRFWINERYDLSDVSLGTAIALSFLGRSVRLYSENPSVDYQGLQEKGLIKLEDNIVKIPYFFVSTFMLQGKNTKYTRFWTTLLIQKNFWWQDWEVFNRNYITFRLSLFAYLGETSVSLKDFFAGSKMNIPEDIDIKIPSLEDLKVSMINYRYPSTEAPAFDIGTHVLNGDGAPFDSFMYLNTNTKPLLLAFQMKMFKQESRTPKVIGDGVVELEFNKINNAVSTCIKGTDFVVIILGNCKGTVTESQLPSKCVVITKEQQKNFYGELYYHRLNKDV